MTIEHNEAAENTAEAVEKTTENVTLSKEELANIIQKSVASALQTTNPTEKEKEKDINTDNINPIDILNSQDLQKVIEKKAYEKANSDIKETNYLLEKAPLLNGRCARLATQFKVDFYDKELKTAHINDKFRASLLEEVAQDTELHSYIPEYKIGEVSDFVNERDAELKLAKAKGLFSIVEQILITKNKVLENEARKNANASFKDKSGNYVSKIHSTIEKIKQNKHFGF